MTSVNLLQFSFTIIILTIFINLICMITILIEIIITKITIAILLRKMSKQSKYPTQYIININAMKILIHSVFSVICVSSVTRMFSVCNMYDRIIDKMSHVTSVINVIKVFSVSNVSNI